LRRLKTLTSTFSNVLIMALSSVWDCDFNCYRPLKQHKKQSSEDFKTMRLLTTALVCLSFLVNAIAFSPATNTDDSRLTLLDATPIKARFTRTISSADAKKGDTIDFEVLEEVKVNDVVVIPRGGTAFGTVTEAKPKGRMGKGGKLDLAIDYVRLINGEKAALRGVKENKGGGSTGAMTGAIVATAIIFLPAAPLFLFMKGKDISIAKGTEITVYVNGDIPVDMAKVNGQARTGGTNGQVANSNANLTINSTPGSADVEINGKFVGSTPSTFSLPAGDHTISVKKNGFTSWERTISLSAGGTITLNVELDRIQ
jgi:hypothetical protein